MTPFRVGPLLRQKPWAGNRIADLAWPSAPPVGTGEVWIISDLPEAASPVLDGPFEGRTLRDVVAAHPGELLGSAHTDRFPLLVKMVDTGPPLSVQVHPDGAIARALGDGERGKCEAWLILASEPNGVVLSGLKPGVGLESVRSLAEAGELPEHMNRLQPALGQGLEIVPGTLHTAEGLLFLEVQETSDITYRVFDYGRGRQLHLEQAQRCLELTGGAGVPGGGAGWPADDSSERRPLTPNSPFRFDAVQLAPEDTLQIEGGTPGVLVVIEGILEVAELTLGPTDSLVLPAAWSGTARAASRVRLGYAVA